MPCSRFFSTKGAAVALLLTGTAMAQNTQPFWSTYFGSPERDHAVAIGRGPGGVVMVAGHTTTMNTLRSSGGLATSGACQTAPNGGQTDAFVACFDPSQPQQLVWCTYFGGTGMELVFDLHVDPVSGVTTIVGLSDSPTLPACTGQSTPTNNGGTDGFVAQFGPMGAVLRSSMFLGGAADDRICDVEVGGSGVVTVAGVTEAPGSLPRAANTYNGGPSDAFAALLVPQNPQGSQVLWSHYLGGSSFEGLPFANWLANGGLGTVWEGNLDRMGLALDAAGNPAVVTVSAKGTMWAQTTPNACQPFHAGASDAYLAVLVPTLQPQPTTLLTYGTFFGGSASDRPQSIARHPDGGFVIGGSTFSNNLPVTTGCLQPAKQVGIPRLLPCNPVPRIVGVDTDGFLCHIDPNPQPGVSCLRYSTYLGGDAGEDGVYALAVETSGVVTVAGSSSGGNFPLTPRGWEQNLGAGHNGAMVARLELAGNGAGDLLYATLAGGTANCTNTNLTGLVLDEFGDAYVAGYHGLQFSPTTSSYATTMNAYQAASAGTRDAVITHLPLLPGGTAGVCVTRQQLALATPACNGLPLYTGMAGAPVPGTTVGFTATNAPPSSWGMLFLGPPMLGPLPPPSTLLVAPWARILLPSSSSGFVRYNIPLRPTLPTVSCWGLSAQWVFLTNGICPGNGPLATSERLDF